MPLPFVSRGARDVGPEGRRARRARSERGAILVQAAIMVIGLTALSGFVADYGILWTARRQAQNSADAAALAAATSLGYIDPTDLVRARAVGILAASRNLVWGQAPVITDADITFPPCPPGAPAGGLCVRADVFRNQAHANPLPTIFNQLVGVTAQGVQATATAEVRFGNSSSCIMPVAIPDKWIENNPVSQAWTPADTFKRYTNGVLLVPADVFDPTFAYDVTPGIGGSEYGTQLVIKQSHGLSRLEAGFYGLIRLPGNTGVADAVASITGCISTADIIPGMVLPVEPGGSPMPIARAFDVVIARDPTAAWNLNKVDDFGAIINLGAVFPSVPGGVDSPFGVSPRVVGIAVFNPDVWDGDPGGGPGGPSPTGSGPNTVTITQIVGAFIESTNGGDITARLVPWQPTEFSGAGGLPGEANVINIVLVR